jgi:hypothetical protein
MVDRSTFNIVTRFTVLASIAVTGLVTLALTSVLDLAVAALVLAIVGPVVHWVVGRLMMRLPEPWTTIGDHLILVGVAYPLVVWIGGTIYFATTGSWAMAALLAVAPLVILLVIFVVGVAMVWDPNRKALRAIKQERQALAAARGWRFVEDGTDVLGERWASPDGQRPRVTAAAVLSGDIQGWPVTICDTIDHGVTDRTRNRTVTCIVHLPASLPETVAVPFNSSQFESAAQGRPWEIFDHPDERPAVEDLYLASNDSTFGERLTTPDVRWATFEGRLMFWRIRGRDLSIARRPSIEAPTQAPLHTASRLVALARALPTDVLTAHGTPPGQPLPFRESSASDPARDAT